jgi:hypothetical protein
LSFAWRQGLFQTALIQRSLLHEQFTDQGAAGVGGSGRDAAPVDMDVAPCVPLDVKDARKTVKAQEAEQAPEVDVFQ